MGKGGRPLEGARGAIIPRDGARATTHPLGVTSVSKWAGCARALLPRTPHAGAETRKRAAVSVCHTPVTAREADASWETTHGHAVSRTPRSEHDTVGHGDSYDAPVRRVVPCPPAVVTLLGGRRPAGGRTSARGAEWTP